MTIEQAKRFPIGTEVRVYESRTAETFHLGVVESAPWSLGNGDLRIWIMGRTMAVPVDRLESMQGAA